MNDYYAYWLVQGISKCRGEKPSDAPSDAIARLRLLEIFSHDTIDAKATATYAISFHHN